MEGKMPDLQDGHAEVKAEIAADRAEQSPRPHGEDDAEQRPRPRGERDAEQRPRPRDERNPASPPAAGEPSPARRDVNRAPPRAAAPGSSHVEVNADKIEAGTFYNNPTFINNGAERTTQAQYKVLAWTDVGERKVSIDGDDTLKAVVILRNRRLLVLRGEPELGKATLALDVIRRAVEAPLIAVLQFQDLETTANVALEDWAGDANYQGRALLFKDAFAGGNASLHGLGRRLSREQVDQLTRTLRDANMFVVFTSDAAALPPEWRGVADELCCEVSAPSESGLRRHLEAEIESFATRPRFGPMVTLQLDSESRARLLRATRTIPRLIRFSRHYFEAIACGRSTVAAALRDFDSLGHWFMLELRDRDPAAWCLAFATCLLAADSAVRRVPWSAAIALAGLLARHLRHTISGWRGREPRFVEPDEALLGAARMEIAADPSSSDGDQVRFQDDRYPADLWRVLTQSGRALLWTVYPLLAAQVERRRPPLWLPLMAALGRIAAIDGWSRIEQPLQGLAAATASLDHLALGRFLVGVKASGADASVDRCVDALRTKAQSTSAWPFMLAMREIGLGDLPRAVREMVDVTQRRIRPRLSGFDALQRALVDALDKRRDASSVAHESAEVTRLLDQEKHDSLNALFALVFDAEIVDFLDAARFATIGLCCGRSPVEVCIAFLPHLEVDPALAVTAPDATLGCIVAMLFFARGEDAVFSVIDRDELKLKTMTSGRAELRYSRVILGLVADPVGRAAPFARFLGCTFDSLSALPLSIGQPMKDHLLACIKRWCREAVRGVQTTAASKELLCCLRSNAGPSLAAAVTVLLRTDDDFRKPGSPLQRLAVDVLLEGDARRTA